MKYQRTELDAFARRRILRRSGIDERSVRPEPGAPVGCGVVALQQQRFIDVHLREIEPPVIGMIGDRISLALPVGLNEVRRHQILLRDAGTITHCKRRVAQRTLDRPPQIDHLHAPTQQFIRLVRQMLMNTVRP